MKKNTKSIKVDIDPYLVVCTNPGWKNPELSVVAANGEHKQIKISKAAAKWLIDNGLPSQG